MRTLEPPTIAAPGSKGLTIIAGDPPGTGGAHHRYEIAGMNMHANPSRLVHDPAPHKQVLLFQNGLVQEAGVNGLTDEALLAIVVDRQRCFQLGPYACPRGGRVLALLEAALDEMAGRTRERIARRVEDTYAV